MLSRYVDVLAAFHEPNLAPAAPRSAKNYQSPDESGRLKVRAEAMDALSPTKLQVWRGQIAAEAHSLAGNLPAGEPVELMNEYARPLCLALAAVVIGISRSTAESLLAQAKQVSAAAAEPFDASLRDDAESASAVLRSHFHSGPDALRDSGFVALSQTIPGILGNTWFALMQHPQQWTLLHQEPELMEQAIEEMLRRAGLVRILGRRATADVNINGASIRRGHRVILRIVAANCDPERYSCPDKVDVKRRDAGHLAFGAGTHACVAGSLIRMATAAITRPLMRRFTSAIPTSPVEWQGGSVFRSPKSLWACLTTADGE